MLDIVLSFLVLDMHVSLRKSILVRLRESGAVFTLNCLEGLSSHVDSLVIHNDLLETLLLSCRQSIAHKVHVLDFAFQEIREFLQSEKQNSVSPGSSTIPLDPLSVRIRFLNLLSRVYSYVDTYDSTFTVNYRDLISKVESFDYFDGVNHVFLSRLVNSDSLSDISQLVEEHGGQIDYHDDYLPILHNYHSTISLTRNLLRSVSDAHSASVRLSLVLPRFIGRLRAISMDSLPRGLPTSELTTRVDFVHDSLALFEALDELDFSSSCDFLEIHDPRVLFDCDVWIEKKYLAHLSKTSN